MRPIRFFWQRLLFVLRRERFDEEIQSELAFHLAMKEQEGGTAGLSPEEAHYAARRQMGPLSLAQEQSRDVWTWMWLEQWTKDIRHATRVLSKSPVFTVSAILILALGVGVNLAIFTLIDALLLRPLPIPEAERVKEVFIQGTGSDMDGMNSLNYPIFEDIRSRVHSLSGLFTWNATDLSVGWGPSARAITGAAVSGQAFRTLGISPQAGRLFLPADDVAGAPLYAVISDRFWERDFSRDPGVVGRKLLLNQKPFTIIGVTPRSFLGVMVGTSPDVTITIHADSELSGHDFLTEKGFWYLSILGRLKPDATEQAARAELATISPGVFQRQISADTEVWHNGQKFVPQKLNLKTAVGSSLPAQQWRRSLWAVNAIAAIMLLMACVNLTSLSLARATARHKELAVRVALGAGRLSLVRQLMTESLLLCIAGVLCGAGLAMAVTQSLITFLSGEGTPLVLDLHPDWRVVGFTVALAVVATVLVGAAPSWGGTQLQPNDALKQTKVGRNTGYRQLLLPRVLTVAQVCLAIVLVTGSMLFVQTLRNLKGQKLGFDRNNLVFVLVDASKAGLAPPQMTQLYTGILEDLRRNPHIHSVSLTNIRPISGSFSWETLQAKFWPTLNAKQRMLYMYDVAPRYFQTMGLQLQRGRDFTVSDSKTSTVPVGILSHSAARTYFPGQDPIGRILRVSEKSSYRIIGEVQDAKYASLREEAPRTLYKHPDDYPSGTLAVRAELDRGAVLRELRQVLRHTGKDVRIGEAISMTEQIDRALTSERLIASLASFFALLAAVLIAIGLFGAVGYAVARRTSEIGIRLALGSSRKDVLWLMMREPLLQSVIGLAVGIPLAVTAANLVRFLLYGVPTYDPVVLSLAALLILLVTTVATFVPAFRAAQLDPSQALHHE
jgi:predicted permease